MGISHSFAAQVAPLAVAAGHYTVGGPRGDGTTRTAQALARPGSYAVGGLAFACPAGRFGRSFGLTDEACDGPCAAGFHCPAGSTRPTAAYCGGPELVCPRSGLAAPLAVAAGYYTETADDADGLAAAASCPPGRWRNASGVVDASLAATPSISGAATRVPTAPCDACPAGTYKTVDGDDLALCAACDADTARDEPGRLACACVRAAGGAPLAAGERLVFHARNGSCLALNASAAAAADAALALAFNATRYARKAQRACGPGRWCAGGVRRPCPAGRYGDGQRETRPTCAGPCAAGHYCPAASTTATARRCGGADRFCPAGSAAPAFVRPGYYGVEGDAGVSEDVRSAEAPCPAGSYCVDGRRFPCAAGRYGASAMSNATTAACDGPCERGYYCGAGATSPREAPCGGPDRVCPTGSEAPLAVPPGYYGVHGGADAAARAAADPAKATLDAMLPCEPGHACAGGLRVPCDPFRYGWRYLQSDPACDGPVAPGCYADPESVLLSDCPHPCGHAGVFCPPTGRERAPTVVSVGHYTTGGAEAYRTAEAPCPPGARCVGGFQLPCPPGKWQPLAGRDRCDRDCPPGHACAAGALAPEPCPAGTFSLGLQAACTPCPGGAPPRGRSQRCFDDRACCVYY